MEDMSYNLKSTDTEEHFLLLLFTVKCNASKV